MSLIRHRGPVERLARAVGKAVLRDAVRKAAPSRQDLPPSTWRLSRDGGGALELDGVALEELLERWGSPLHVVDARRLIENARRFMARPAGTGRRCEVFYSYKTNPVPGVLMALHAAGVGAEVISDYELWLALRLGVPPERIVYNGPGKSPESLLLAAQLGLGLVNANSRDELPLIAGAARVVGRRVRVGIRVATPGSVGGQFGERIDTPAALAAFQEALQYPQLHVVAVHSHRNGEIGSEEALEAYLSELLAFTDELRRKLDLELEIVDVGGNLANPTVGPLSALAHARAVTFGCEPTPPSPGSVLGVDAYVRGVLEQVEHHYREAGQQPPRVFLEPGRALTGNAQMLLCRVQALQGKGEGGLTWAVLDAGVNVAEAVRNEFHQLFPLREPPGAARRLYRLVGPSCTLGDVLYPAWRLPELAPGSGLAIMDSGAYFVPFSTCFSRPRPAVLMLSGGKEIVLRRAETFEDLVALDGPRRPPRPRSLQPAVTEDASTLPPEEH